MRISCHYYKKENPIFSVLLSENTEIEAGEVLKIKEFTVVIDCF